MTNWLFVIQYIYSSGSIGGSRYMHMIFSVKCMLRLCDEEFRMEFRIYRIWSLCFLD